MIIQPKIRGFFCLTAHPHGCRAHVQSQIDYVTRQGPIAGGPSKVLVIGGSTGYGLASRITTGFGSDADTLGVHFEKEPSDRRPATAGWYNTMAFERAAQAAGRYAESVNGDAFSDEMKSRVVDKLAADLGPVDMVIYSLASPRRMHPKTGEVSQSVLKPIGTPYEGRTLDTDKREVKPVSIEPATHDEIEQTIAVMGGEDWEMWIDALDDAKLLAPGCRTLTYTYLGSELTWPIYRAGTIGKAKEDLERVARSLDARLAPNGGGAHVAVMKAVVTQSSSAIPVVPLYISLLYKVMKLHDLHEGTIEQVYRLFATKLFGPEGVVADDDGLIRLDDWEMRDDVQQAVAEVWPLVSTATIDEHTDFDGYRADFLELFGFGRDDVDYEADVDPHAPF